jgi:hypothetical protein
MGYSYVSLIDIVKNKKKYHDKKILTLGVLFPYVEKNKDISDLLINYGVDVTTPLEKFSEHLFCEICGANSCDALDVSDYQGAKLICNLNLPIDKSYYDKYDVIIDAGTLEHLSNIPVAINNVFSLLRVNGIYDFGGPCNGWVDHGFFQFSPTFYKDMVFKNDKFIELDKLYISEGKSILNVMKVADLRMTSFVTSHKKINVSGAIRKIYNGEINFDLIQAKYRKWHNRDSNSTIKKKNILKVFFVKLFVRICRSILVPYMVKDILLRFFSR